MQSEIKETYISLLDQIKSKPIIVEKIFSYAFSRPNILLILISKDKTLVKKLNDIFSSVPKYTSNLDKEFIDNLNKYSRIREKMNQIEEIYNKISKNNNITYNDLKNKYKFSYINYIFEEGKKKYSILDESSIKKIIYDFVSTLDSFTLIFLPQKYQYLDGNYINDIYWQNLKSQEKFKNKQKIKLLLLFDENYFFNNISYNIKIPNIEEIEIIFDNEFKELFFKHNHLLYVYFNNYLSKIDTLDSITKINFHNLQFEDELYQSVLGYFFDGFFSETNEDLIQQTRLMKNLKVVNIEMTFLYIYEKIKLYYYIYEIFPSLSLYASTKKIVSDVSFSYNINNKILIINNNDAPLNSRNLINFIDLIWNNDENIEFIYIVNHNKLNRDEEKSENSKENKKLDLSKLREFTFINEKNNDIKNLMNKFIFNNQKSFNIYEGYDKDNNLIYYRVGESPISSFDLIEIFKNNKILERVELVNEEIEIIYNKERNNLQILYKGKIKKDKIINNSHFLPINTFSKFIKNQKDLKELIINRFDFCLKALVNDNIKILTINYEKNDFTLDYKINTNEDDTLNLFPNLVVLNLGTSSNKIDFLRKLEIPKGFKTANLIFKNDKVYDLSKIRNKFKKRKKELNIEFLKSNDEEEEYDDEENEDEYNEIEEEENFNYKLSDYL